MTHPSLTHADLMLRGSVLKVKRTCGKTRCICRQGKPHETWALSYSYQGHTRMVPLRPEDVPIAKQGVKRYRQAVERLEKQALRDIKRLHNHIKAEKKRAR